MIVIDTYQKIRDLVKNGCIADAIKVTNEISPGLLVDNPRLLFKLQKQHVCTLLLSSLK